MAAGYPVLPITDDWLASIPIGAYLLYDTEADTFKFKYACIDDVAPGTFPTDALTIKKRRHLTCVLK